MEELQVGDIPGSGGKRMARMPRKMSVEHIVAEGEQKTAWRWRQLVATGEC